VANLVDSAPDTLNTLAELATSIGNSTTLSSTLTTSIATKLPLAGGTLTGHLNLGDNVIAKFGLDSDLAIYHDGSNSHIRDQGTGNLQIEGQSDVKIMDNLGSTTMATFRKNGPVFLAHNNSTKFATTATGIDVTGNIAVSGTVDGIDIAARDAVLTSTTTTAGAALPKAGGTLTGTLTTRDVTVSDGYILVDGGTTSNTTLEAVLWARSQIGASMPQLNVQGDQWQFGGGGTLDTSPTMTVDYGSGNVGIGTTAPDSPLEISGADDTRLKLTDTGDSSELMLRSDGANTQIYTNTAHDLGIYTSGNLGQLHLKQSNGNVGIGTSAPGYALDLIGATNYRSLLIGQSEATGAKRQAIAARHYTSSEQDHNMIGMFTDSNTNSILTIGGGLGVTGDFNSVTEIQLHTGNGTTVNTTAAMTIDDTGNVGIGTSSPYSKLNVQGTSASTYTGTGPGVTIRASQGTAGNWIASEHNGAFAYFGIDNGRGKYAAYNYATNAEMDMILGQDRIYIKSDGNVGIGTDNPGEKLEVNGALRLGQSSSLGTAQLTHHTNNFLYIRGGSAGAIISDDSGINTLRVADGSSGYVMVETGDGTERMRVNSDGITINNGKELRVKRPNGSGDIRLFNTSTYATLESTVDPIYIKSANDIRFDTNGNDQRMIIRNNGNVAMGSATDGTAPLHLKYASGSYGAESTSGFISNATSGRGTIRIRSDADAAAELFYDVGGALRWDVSVRTAGEGYQMNWYPQSATPVFNNVSAHVMSLTQGGNLYAAGDLDLGGRLDVGTFPNSQSNTGEAWIGRASDRPAGTLTVQLGGSTNNGTKFEIVDRAWTKVISSISGEAPESSLHVKSSGNVGIGPYGYNSGDGLDLIGQTGRLFMDMNYNSTGAEILLINNRTANGTTSMIQYRTNSVVEGSIIGNGSGLTISNVSDYRKKENIRDLTGSLSIIKSLQPRVYEYREGFGSEGDHIGFIAHEIQAHIPKAVTGDKDDLYTQTDIDEGASEVVIGEPKYQAVSYTHNEIITRLVQSIQELEARITALEG
jgi:hypothetical protein